MYKINMVIKILIIPIITKRVEHNPINNQISLNKNYPIAIIKCPLNNNNNTNNNYIHSLHNPLNQFNHFYKGTNKDNIIFKTKVTINIRNHNVSRILDSLILNKTNIIINRIQFLIMI